MLNATSRLGSSKSSLDGGSAAHRLSRAQRWQLKGEWNDTAVAFPQESTLPELFRSQARLYPHRVALVFGEQQLTYGELARRAKQLGDHLRALGVGPEMLVGLSAERSLEMVIALLAILEAGGAYLPLDPDYPQERLAFMMEDARVTVLLAHRHLLPRLPTESARVICLDGPMRWLEDSPGPRSPTRPAASSEQIAYVLYTSGSTGRPKGVEVCHRSIARLVKGATFARMTQREVFLQMAPLAFDASTLELWGSLLNGARLVIMAPGPPTLEELAGVLRRQRVNILWLTAGLFHQMVDAQLRVLGGLRQLLAGGDVLSLERVRKVLETHPECRLINGYGPTESTTFATCHGMHAARPPQSAVPIGRAISNTRVFVLDEELRLVPSGTTGELCIAGHGLARGYHRRPALSAERFVPNPLASVPGERIYRTGDRARHRSDGVVEFLGRLDSQVKIRGFRIELGEVESSLETHPQVREAVVLARSQGEGRDVDESGGGASGRLFLTAFVVPKVGGRDVLEPDLGKFLRLRLPRYMLPRSFEVLPTLPLTANGKIDRQALRERALPVRREPVAEERKGPLSPVEEVLAAIFEEVLAVDIVALEDDFFELGGHSLTATQVLSRVRRDFGVELSIREFFELPTVAELARQVAGARRELVGGPAPESGAADDEAPLSFAQQRLWFLDRLEPGSPLYNIPLVIGLRGSLRPAILEACLREIVRRHEVLRTAFRSRHGRPLPAVTAVETLDLPAVDLRSLPGAIADAELDRLAAYEARLPFDLAVAPLMRATLVRRAPQNHQLLLTVHHIAADGWSLAVLIRELRALYRLYTGVDDQAPAEPALQYADFAAWQRQWLRGSVLERQLDYWRQQLDGSPPVLELPTDRPRPEPQSYAGGQIEARLGAATTAALRAFSRRRGTTLFMALLAGFVALLGRISGRENIVVGTPVANRNRLEIEALIGFFVNTLVLRLDLTGRPTFLDLLERARRVCLGAYSHQDLPFEKLVEELQPERSLGHHPLCQVLLALQNTPPLSEDCGDLELSWRLLGTGTSQFDLTLSVREAGEDLAISCQYAEALFDRTTVQRWLHHLGALLAEACRHPGQSWLDLPLLSVAARHQLLVEWNDTGLGTLVPKGPLVHDLLRRQGEKTADAVAIYFESPTGLSLHLSYGELVSRARHLAGRLVGHGVGAGDLVGICLSRCPAMIVALFGVLEAGAGYLPLDPGYPANRRKFMLRDAAARVLLTLPGTGSPADEISIETVDFRAGTARPGGARPRRERVSASHLAYVTYTSGSTGKPKGVAVTHGSVAALVAWARRCFAPEELQGMLASTSICFDLSVFEIFVTLDRGGTLILVRDALELLTLRSAGPVTMVNTVPSAMAELVRLSELPHSVSTVAVAGEPLSRPLVRQIYRRSRAAAVWNLYGPSEDTTYSTASLVSRRGSRPPSIGRPIAASQSYVLDSHLHPQPVGVGGELFLGGAGLARGYLRRPSLTALRFVPDPYSRVSGGRLYRTGDRVLVAADGRLTFVGRLDHQVKIRGFRVELGEIEAALEEHPLVEAATVLARQGQSGDVRLVTYGVPARGAPSSRVLTVELTSWLRESLPAHMTPSAFEWLDALPQTPNGKVDRKALGRRPLPELAQRESAPGRGPRSAEEEVLVGVWSEVLGADEVGVEQNFFELGGHSLLATQVLARIRQVLGVSLPVRQLFETPTVAGLAKWIEAARKGRSGRDPLPLVAAEPGASPTVSFAQERLWFLDRLEPDSSLYNLALVVRLEGELRAELLAPCLRQIVERHQVLRTVFEEDHGQVAIRVVEVAELEVPWVDLRSLPDGEEEALRLAKVEARRPFDLTAAPLLRCQLLILGSERHRLVLTLHHIAADGWSIGVLTRELADLYRFRLAGGTSSDVPELLGTQELQYSDFAAWQRRWFRGALLEAQLSYWCERLAGSPALLPLPTDRPRPAVQSFAGAQVSWRLGSELTVGLRRLARTRGATFFMSLLAGVQTLLARLSGQRDIAVGTPVANRERVELEGLIGPFVNTLVLRTRLADHLSFEDLLAQVREVCLGAYAHQDLPFERLVEARQPERSLAHSPLFQTLFVLQSAPLAARQLGDARVRLQEVDGGSSKFDLLLSLAEEGYNLDGVCEYATALFDRTTIERWLGHLRRLLAGAVTNPATRLADLPLLGPAARQQLLREWGPGWRENDPLAHGPACLHQWVEAQARRSPERLALLFERRGGQTVALSYAEIDKRSEVLADRLYRHGARAETLVGISLPRCPEMVVAMLAVLKTGAAYLPLDPEYPATRRQFMLDDARVRIVVVPSALPSVSGAPDGELDLLIREDVSELTGPPASLSGDHLAYVIYTSGSTGKPKGVAITHRSAVALLAWARQTFGDEDLSAVLASTSICFDLSVFEVFVTLGHGGTLCLVRDALELPTQISAHRVSLINTVPSVMAELLHQGGLPNSLRVVNLAGEALPRPLVESLFEHTEIRRVWNLYGPSEDTTYSTAARLKRGFEGVPPIGQAIDGTRSYVVDGAGRLAAPGAEGELYLGGMGLARGYLRRPALCAERFVPDPWSGLSGRRLYRTGDRVRFEHHGILRFLGRIDGQVKVRGFRIELGEIEATLRQHPQVDAVAVLLWDEAGDHRVVAHVVPRPDAGEDLAGRLRAFLRARLPAHMIPAALDLLPELPLTPNGKVDRQALRRRPPVASRNAEPTPSRPESPLEEVLSGIWAEVLGVGTGSLGVHDNFFELGGHSLLATRVNARLRDLLGVDLPMRTLFETPTVSSLAARIRGLRVESRKGLPAISRVPGEDPAPLAAAQERFWFHDVLEPSRAVYNLALASRLTGAVNVAALAATVRHLADRHPVLRTRFNVVDGELAQLVAGTPRPRLAVVDLEALPEARYHAESLRLAHVEARCPFDLARGPLLRVTWLRQGAASSVLLLTLHHIVCDGSSFEIFTRELGALYETFAEGRRVSLPELAVRYTDFVRWQRRWWTDEMLAEHLSYWCQHLAGVPQLELPTDRPRPAVPSFRGAQQTFLWPADLTAAIKGLLGSRGTTLFMTVLGALFCWVSRSSGNLDFVVGTPVDHRDRLELEGVMGLFLNTLVLRADLSGQPTFGELLMRVREETLAAHDHQEVAFERLVSELELARDPSRHPLFQVMLVVQAKALDRFPLGNLGVEPLEVDRGTAQLDLTISIEDGECLGGVVEYSRDLWDATTAQRGLAQLRQLLAAGVANPETPVEALPLMSVGEYHQLVVEPERASARSGLPRLEQLVAAQGARTPHAVAAVLKEAHLSYGTLGRRVRRLARRLHDQGVRRGTVVALLAGRSFDLLVGILGILEAGGAYVPLDPDYPTARLAFLLEDSEAAWLLSSTSLKHRLPDTDVPTLWLEGGETETSPHPDPDRCKSRTSGDARDLAYVIYTSGSTGRPKGVAVEHAAVVHRVLAMKSLFRLGLGKRQLQFVSPGFDVLGEELYPTLSSGATVVLHPRPDLRTPVELLEDCATLRVTKVDVTASYWQQIVEQLEVRAGMAPRCLEVVVVGGESTSRDKFSTWCQRTPGTLRTLHVYGPTEAAILATCHEVSRSPRRLPREPRLSIGRALAGGEVWLLDPRLQPVPLGVHGEFYLGGPLAWGYLGRSATTAASFLPHPLAHRPGARLYRTGDLARRLADGSLEFLGRSDQQVKVRGRRLELGEIESTLERHPALLSAVVVAKERSTGDLRLVAYVVPRPGAEAGVEELEELARKEFPLYMVPESFIAVASLPRTTHGKVDTAALPDPVWKSPEPGAAGALNPTEELLAGLWSELLGVEEVTREDSFFDLGGHSLLAARLTSKVLEIFGVEVPLMELFGAPRLAELAAFIETAQHAAEDLARPRLLPVSSDEPLPLSFAQERFWFLDRLDGGNPAYNLPAAWRLLGALRIGDLGRGLTEVVRRHEVLRTRFELVGGQPVGRVEPVVSWPLPVVDLQALPTARRPAEEKRWSRHLTCQGFDLSRLPLRRALLLRRDPQNHLLVVVFHHAVADGWSISRLAEEIVALYGAQPSEDAAPLEPLGVQYADYGVWQRRCLEGERLERQLHYWQQKLDGLPALELPIDRPRPARQGFRGRRFRFALPEPLGHELKATSRRQGVTLFMTLLAGFGTVLSRWSGQRDFALGTPIANRATSELEPLIGLFLNTLVLRLEWTAPGGNGPEQVGAPSTPKAGQFLRQVRLLCLEAYGHAEVPFERLVEALRPERDLGRTPLFQVLFSLQNLPSVERELDGLTLRAEEVDNGLVPFDLILGLEEDGDLLRGAVDYSTDLFETTTIARMVRHLEVLLGELASSLERPIDDLPMLSASERHQMLEWNATEVPGAVSVLPRWLAERTSASRDALALSQGAEHLSFGELAARRARLGEHLEDAGVSAEVAVAVCVERSFDRLIALLAVFEVGGVYVPLDPEAPVKRLLWMLQDARARVLVIERSLVGNLSVPEMAAAGKILVLEEGGVGRDAVPPPRPRPRSRRWHPESLAYVLYTSGSTGRPKGVMISHRAIWNTLRWRLSTFALSSSDTILQNIPSTFDPSLWQIFGALLAGGRLVVLPPGGHKDFTLVSRTLSRQRVTITDLAPSMLEVFLESGGADSCATLRLLFVGGEALPRPLERRALDALPGELFNIYGPTETAVDSACHRCVGGDPVTGVPIGRPMDNKKVLVCDRTLRPVPFGCVGELCVAGEGLARGYRGRPGKTAERFVPVPTAVGADASPGARLYRTGDAVRQRKDGAIDFLGRLDRQVKVRGFRIELGEVESVLREHSAVREGVVMARRDVGGQASNGPAQLVGYVVLRDGDRSAEGDDAATLADVRAFLSRRLPEPMVPAFLVTLETMPLTTSGKVDRRALPAPAASETRQHVAPRTRLERDLVEIWRRVLGIENPGIEDNFFDLGGHSLMLARVQSQLEKLLDRSVPLVDLLTHPKISALARHLGGEGRESPALREVPDKARRQIAAAARRKKVARSLKRPRRGS